MNAGGGPPAPAARALPGGGPGAGRRWLLAVRPPTLTAAVAPVLVGCGLAWGAERFAAGPALAALAGAVAIQVGANLANDVSDFRKGADTAARIGPPRVTQLGLLSERQVLCGMWTAFALAALCGVYLAAVAGWPVVAIGLASIAAALAYSGGPWAFGYRGLGEPFTFVFFGLIAVGGTYFVQAGSWGGAALAAALPVGCTVTAILVVNNVRDIETDRAAGEAHPRGPARTQRHARALPHARRRRLRARGLALGGRPVRAVGAARRAEPPAGGRAGPRGAAGDRRPPAQPRPARDGAAPPALRRAARDRCRAVMAGASRGAAPPARTR